MLRQMRRLIAMTMSMVLLVLAVPAYADEISDSIIPEVAEEISDSIIPEVAEEISDSVVSEEIDEVSDSVVSEDEASSISDETDENSGAVDAGYSLNDDEDDDEEIDPIIDTYDLDSGQKAEIAKEVIAAATAICGAITSFIAEDASVAQRAFIVGGGLTATAGGVVSILQITGAIEDSTTVALSTIESKLDGISDQLTEVDKKVDGISKQLSDYISEQAIKDRKDNADKEIRAWREFRENYLHVLETDKELYEGYINEAISDWWQEEHDTAGIPLTYCRLSLSDYELALSKDAKYVEDINDLPEMADNGMYINRGRSFCVTPERIIQTKNIPFNVDTYKEDYVDAAWEQIWYGLDRREFPASEAFYDRFFGLDYDEQEELAREYAGDLFAAIVYSISFDTMRKHHSFVINTKNHFQHYCEELSTPDYGLDALLKAQIYTHGFEGEIDESIKDTCNEMILLTYLYGELALGAASQDVLITKQGRVTIRDKMLESLSYISDKRHSVLTGYPNYCYITNTLVEYKRLQALSDWGFIVGDPASSLLRYVALGVYESRPWKVYEYPDTGTDTQYDIYKIPFDNINSRIVGNTAAKMLYRLYLSHEYVDNKGKKMDFQTYLREVCNVDVPSSTPYSYVTSYTGPNTWSLNKEYSLDGKDVIGWGSGLGQKKILSDDFADSRPTKVTQSNFPLHDQILADTFDWKSGKSELNKEFGTRAAYNKHYTLFYQDEQAIFTNGNYSNVENNRYREDDTIHYYRFSVPFNVLALEAVPEPQNPDESYDIDDDERRLWFDIHYHGVTNDYSDYAWDNVNTILQRNDIDDEMRQSYEEMIGRAIERAKDNGLNVVLSDGDKDSLISEMYNRYYKWQNDVTSNSNLSYLDASGIDGDGNKELEVAKLVLPSTYLDENGNCLVPADAMTIKVDYSPYTGLEFKRVDGEVKPIILDGIEVQPKLLLWDSNNEEYYEFDIRDEVMSECGITVDLRVPLPSDYPGKVVDLVHYSRFVGSDVLGAYTANVQEKAGEKYSRVPISASGLLVFEEEQGLWVGEIPDQIYSGKPIRPIVSAYDGSVKLEEGKDYTVSYSNNEKAYAYKEGQAGFNKDLAPCVTITGKNNYGQKLNIYFAIRQKSLLSEDITVSVSDKKYNGKPLRSVPVVKFGGVKLKENRDYTIQYSGDLVNPGTVDITVKGCGNYCGYRKVTYRIFKDETDFSKVYVAPIPKQKYTGKPIEPELTVKTSKDAAEQISSDDYEVIFQNNTNVGTATAIIRGNGAYGGYGNEKKITFKIGKRDLQDVSIVVTDTVIYTGRKLQPTIKVIDPLSGKEISAGDYKVKYTNNVNVPKSGSTKLPTVTISGSGNYTGKASATFAIIPQEIGNRAVAIVNDMRDSNKEIKAENLKCVVKLDGKKLKRGSDYTVEFTRASNQASQVATVLYTGNYAGTASCNFRIYQAEMKSLTYDKIASMSWTGKRLCPSGDAIKIYKDKAKSVRLEEGKDYALSYGANTNVGYGTVVVTGIGDYNGTKKLRFLILPKWSN